MRVIKKQTQIQRIKILEKIVGKLYMDLQEVKLKLRESETETTKKID